MAIRGMPIPVLPVNGLASVAADLGSEDPWQAADLGGYLTWHMALFDGDQGPL